MMILMTAMRHGAWLAAIGLTLLLPASAQQKDPPDQAAKLQGETAREKILAKWTGDLDGMIERRVIRVLTTYSKTNLLCRQRDPARAGLRYRPPVRGRPQQ